jgi:hypothetical protein
MKRFLVVLAALALGLAGQAWSSGAAAQDNAPGWGTIKGQVFYGGKTIPPREKLKVDKDQAHCLAMGDLYSDEWLINAKNRGVRNVFVWLIQADPKSTDPLPIHPKLKSVPTEPLVIDQPHCQFKPRCVQLREGQVLLAKNSAPVPHNFHLVADPRFNVERNFVMPPKSQNTVKDLKAQRLPMPLKCDIHGWMQGRVAIYDHPYFALTDEDGKFEIKLAPAGSYRVMVYHEAVGYLDGAKGRNGRPITISANGTADLGKLKLMPRPK